jgi:hypothetical protein
MYIEIIAKNVFTRVKSIKALYFLLEKKNVTKRIYKRRIYIKHILIFLFSLNRNNNNNNIKIMKKREISKFRDLKNKENI